MSKPLVVGESPGKSGLSAEDPVNQVYGSPGRLLRLMGADRVTWVNLLPVETLPWPRDDARHAADLVIREHSGWNSPWLLLGRRVCAAFGLTDIEWLGWYVRADVPGRILAVPHPSGLNRWWNDPSNVARATDVLRAVARGELVA